VLLFILLLQLGDAFMPLAGRRGSCGTWGIAPSAPSIALSSSGGAIDIEKINDYQWDMFTTHHLGEWKGVQTGYSPNDDEVADHMFNEASMQMQADGSVSHINRFVIGEIRTDCEVCFDSERYRERDMGAYVKGKLMQRYCWNAQLKGPGSNPRGASLELGLRHGDARVRVLCNYSPVLAGGEQGTEEWALPVLEEEVDEEGAPVTLAYRLELRDVVIVRERLDSRPLELDGQADPLWQRGPNILSKLQDRAYSQSEAWRLRMDMQGQTIKQPSFTGTDNPELLSLLDLVSSGTGDRDLQPNTVSGERNPTFSRLFPGSLLLSAPRCLNLGEKADIRLGWAPSAHMHMTDQHTVAAADLKGLEGGKAAYVVGVSVVLTEPCVVDSSGIYVKPPQLADYYVDVLAGGV